MPTDKGSRHALRERSSKSTVDHSGGSTYYGYAAVRLRSTSWSCDFRDQTGCRRSRPRMATRLLPLRRPTIPTVPGKLSSHKTKIMDRRWMGRDQGHRSTEGSARRSREATAPGSPGGGAFPGGSRDRTVPRNRCANPKDGGEPWRSRGCRRRRRHKVAPVAARRSRRLR